MKSIYIPEILANIKKYERLLQCATHKDSVSDERLFQVGKELRVNIQELNMYLKPRG